MGIHVINAKATVKNLELPHIIIIIFKHVKDITGSLYSVNNYNIA